MREAHNAGGPQGREKNAVVLSRDERAIHVETFELSPRNKSVMTTIGRLQRLFPKHYQVYVVF